MSDEGIRRPPTFGEKAVGLDFNPSGDSTVGIIKKLFADAIDFMNEKQLTPGATEQQKRMYSVAITDAQNAQMWAVKAATWPHKD